MHKNQSLRILFFVCLVLFFLWIILFEYIFPLNRFIPSPSLVFLSFVDLFSKYDFLLNIVSTLASIYMPMFLALVLLKFSFGFIDPESPIIKLISSSQLLFKFIPGLLLGVLLIYWFPQEEWTKFLFSFFIALSIIWNKAFTINENKFQHYKDYAQSLGIKKYQIRTKVIWKMVEPRIIEELAVRNIYIWTTILAFEYIQRMNGAGEILRLSLKFNDISIIFALIIFLAVIISLCFKILNFIKNKFYFWND